MRSRRAVVIIGPNPLLAPSVPTTRGDMRRSGHVEIRKSGGTFVISRVRKSTVTVSFTTISLCNISHVCFCRKRIPVGTPRKHTTALDPALGSIRSILEYEVALRFQGLVRTPAITILVIHADKVRAQRRYIQRPLTDTIFYTTRHI